MIGHPAVPRRAPRPGELDQTVVVTWSGTVHFHATRRRWQDRMSVKLRDRHAVDTGDARLRVLLIEHDPKMVSLVRNILTDDGYEVVGMTVADDALNQLDDLDPDVIVLDEVMPRAKVSTSPTRSASARRATDRDLQLALRSPAQPGIEAAGLRVLREGRRHRASRGLHPGGLPPNGVTGCRESPP